jgi:hypothetical protein
MDIPWSVAFMHCFALPLCQASVHLFPPQALVLINLRSLSVVVKMVVVGRNEKGERTVDTRRTL